MVREIHGYRAADWESLGVDAVGDNTRTELHVSGGSELRTPRIACALIEGLVQVPARADENLSHSNRARRLLRTALTVLGESTRGRAVPIRGPRSTCPPFLVPIDRFRARISDSCVRYPSEPRTTVICRERRSPGYGAARHVDR